MLESYTNVVPVIDNPQGWTRDDVDFFHNPMPDIDPHMFPILEAARQRTIHERTAEFTGGRFRDTNGAKAAVRRLLPIGSHLNVYTDLTEYFVLWGLPTVAPDLHNQALEDLKYFKRTNVPIGISTHNVVLLTPDGSRNPETASVVAIINSNEHGFAAGKLSLSYEGQLDPTKDLDFGTPSTFETVARTLQEEFGIGLPDSPLYALSGTRLLAVCAERQSQYTSWIHAIWVEGSTEELLASYEQAPRRNDSKVLFSIPLSAIDAYAEDEIGPHTYARDIIKGSLRAGAILNPHPTVRWRVDALKDHLATFN